MTLNIGSTDLKINMENTIYLRRRNKLLIPSGDSILGKAYIAAFLKNIESLGYTFSPEAITRISVLSVKQLKPFYNELISDLQVLVGAHKQFNPMYPNFPQQVMDASKAELYLNAFIHYFGDFIGKRILPTYKKEERDELKDKTGLKVIRSGTKQDFEQILTNLLGSKTSLTQTDKSDIEWFVKTYQNNIVNLLPKEIPLKENIALLCSCLIKYTSISQTIIPGLIKTATDVLRLASAMSEGDISLAANTKFRNFSQNERRILLGVLENCNSITEDMLRYKNRWKRLGEKLHPFDYREKFPKCFEGFDIVRNDKPFKTFNSKVESTLLNREIDKTAGLLKTRPGEYARRLDNLLRNAEDKSGVIDIFNQIAGNVSNPVLLQLIAHFKHRHQQQALRTFFPKGDVGKAKVIENNLPGIERQTCEQVVSICEDILIGRYKALTHLGNVYVDKNLIDYTVPFTLRSASKALKTVARGSKINIPEGDTLRFFIWWKDGMERTDIDLSAVALDENFVRKTDIAYYNLKELGGYHSGDITSAPDGASEFIDIDISAFIKTGIRYVVLCVNSFTSQPFFDLPECFAGIMIRQYPNSGEIYEPKTVENKFDLTSKTRLCIPLIVDLHDRKIFWTDIALTHNALYNNNVYNNMPAITIIAQAMTQLIKPNLYDLFKLHAKARGTIVEDINQANTIFAVDKGITPFDIDLIISTFL